MLSLMLVLMLQLLKKAPVVSRQGGNEGFRRRSDSEPLELQINVLVRAERTITNLGLTLDDKPVAFAIISSLPSSIHPQDCHQTVGSLGTFDGARGVATPP